MLPVLHVDAYEGEHAKSGDMRTIQWEILSCY